MKNFKLKSILTALFLTGVVFAYAQQPALQYFRANDKDGLNVFETSKENDVEFTGVKVRVGGDFAMQFQGLSQTNAGDSLTELANNFNLPTANLNLDVQLADGMRMHLRTYLSSRHHTEAYVKGGYIQIDKLDFIRKDFMSGFMNVATIRVGMDEFNYGDAHFRRSDNARAIFNPFVGNYIMDSFTTEPFAELTINTSGFIGVLGATNGRLNQSPLPGDDGFVLFGKLGYDDQINDDLRLRLTGSFYSSSDKGTRDYLYNGDRAGGRYYQLLGTQTISSSDFSPRFNPGFKYQTAFQINPFVKFKGLEFFGVFEVTSNGDDAVGGSFTQLGAEALYRFGGEEQLYLGGRFNSVSGEMTDAAAARDTQRINFGGGWFMTKNVLAKIEYVKQTYDGAGWNGSQYQGAEFNGVVIEATIGF
ncbi:hypothetical protein [Marinoscillum sp. 108]|uniref:hypothetical protein n=1 Tax=Marinoscillum sp. 108 TaxID=2653151 RepID=UPI0012F3AF98|nr:hypothetical protein [Marinoscillum sp. 108]VXD12922.1 conserved exported hypothetical protein [Marinoscillum sp. 108]